MCGCIGRYLLYQTSYILLLFFLITCLFVCLYLVCLYLDMCGSVWLYWSLPSISDQLPYAMCFPDIFVCLFLLIYLLIFLISCLLICVAVRGCIGRYLPYQTNPQLSTSTLPHPTYQTVSPLFTFRGIYIFKHLQINTFTLLHKPFSQLPAFSHSVGNISF